MRYRGIVAAGLLGLFLALTPAGSQAKEKRERLTLQAQRAGWMLGMYVGEEPGKPYPFVVQVDPNSDARVKGVRAGDEILRFDGTDARPLRLVYERAQELRPNQMVELWLRRGAQTLRVRLTVPKDVTATPSEKSDKPERAAKASKKSSDEKQANSDDKKKKKRPVIRPVPVELD